MPIIFDNHLHLNRNGRFLDAVTEFTRAGGTHFVLCQLPMVVRVIKEKRYSSCFLETLTMADEIRSMIDVGVYVTVGPYPVDYLKLKNHFGRAQTLKIMRSGIDEAAKLCEEKRCIAIGEIGRPHFPVDEQTFADVNELLLYGMQKAHDSNVPVVLHTERTTPEQCKELVEMGKKAGLAPDHIVKHFAPPLIHPSENHGLIPSVLASKQNIFEACKKGTRFMMETDYIDDVTRPGAVLSPKTVPRRTKELLNHSILNEKQLCEIHQTLPEKTYGISLEG